MKHIAIAAVLVIVVTILVIIGLEAIDLVPKLASAEGSFVDQMFRVQLYFIAFFFSLIVVLVLYSVVVFRRKAGDTGDGVYVKGNTPLEIAWTVIPLVIVMGLGVWGAQHLNTITAADSDELLVEVTGFQFGWRFDYPQHGVTSSDLYLPVDRQVLFKLTSTDVIHSFWVPEFRIKQDAVPGMWTELRVTPTETGDYRIRCAELCGYAHAGMYAPVVVVEEAEFNDWLAGNAVQRKPEGEMTPVERGEALASEQGCLSCHTLDGSDLVGPTWQGLYGSERQLEGGTTVVADDEYLKAAIVDPKSQIVAGYTPIMTMYDFLADEDVSAIVEYIKSLSE